MSTDGAHAGAEEMDVGKALGTDYMLIRDQLTEAEVDYLERTRSYVDDLSLIHISEPTRPY